MFVSTMEYLLLQEVPRAGQISGCLEQHLQATGFPCLNELT